MNKYLLVLLPVVVLLGIPNLALAASAGAPAGGGFEGPGPAVITAEQAKALSDDAKVRLRGSIVDSLGGDKYTFRDQSGTVIVEIETEKWRGQKISPQDTVEIHGEVDKNLLSAPEIEVDRIDKI